MIRFIFECLYWLAVGLVIFAGILLVNGCTTVRYQYGDATIEYTKGLLEKEFQSLEAGVDPQTGEVMLFIEGYKDQFAVLDELIKAYAAYSAGGAK